MPSKMEKVIPDPEIVSVKDMPIGSIGRIINSTLYGGMIVLRAYGCLVQIVTNDDRQICERTWKFDENVPARQHPPSFEVELLPKNVCVKIYN